MLTLKHKQALCPQFQKLAQLDSLGLFTNEFIIGFVCGQLPSPINKYEWKTLSDKLEKMKKMVLTKAITVHNVIEVLLVSLATIADLLSSSKTQTSGLQLRRFMLALDENTNEVIINPNVLKEKYFHETEETENKKRRGEINNKKQELNRSQEVEVKRMRKEKNVSKEKKAKKDSQYSDMEELSTKKLIHISQQLRSDVQKALVRPPSIKLVYKNEKESEIEKTHQNKEHNHSQKRMEKQKASFHKQYSETDFFMEKEFDQSQSEKSILKISKPSSAIKIVEECMKEEPKNPRFQRKKSPEMKKSFGQKNKHESEIKESSFIQSFPCLKICKAESFEEEDSYKMRKKEIIPSKALEKKESMPQKAEKKVFFSLKTDEKKSEESKLQEKKQPCVEELGIECQICCEKITFFTMCPVACGHILHQSCLNEYFRNQVLIKSFPILCPESGCTSQLALNDIQEFIQPKIKTKYFEFSFQVFVEKNSSTINWCPTPGCSAVFQLDSKVKEYKCMSCHKTYCTKCRFKYHNGMTCEQYREIRNMPEEDRKFVDYVNQCNWKQCPSCKFWVERSQGCDHMTCRCKYEFCYKCGKRYNNCGC